MKIYIANLTRGRNHPEWGQFYENLTELNAQPPDHGGIRNMALFSSHHDFTTIHLLVTDNIKNTDDITIEEITSSSLKNDPTHKIHTEMVNSYFNYVTLV